MADFRIFISHSSRDRVFINKLCKLLELKGLKNYYLAERPVEFKPSKDLAETILNEIGKCCQCVVVVITARSVNSPWVNQEIGYAFHARREMVLILEEEVISPALVAANQYASFLGENISTDIREKVIPYLQKRKQEIEGAK